MEIAGELLRAFDRRQTADAHWRVHTFQVRKRRIEAVRVTVLVHWANEIRRDCRNYTPGN